MMTFSEEQTHYLKNVLRMKVGSELRLFNERDGEWLAALTTLEKKACSVKLLECLRIRPEQKTKKHLFFAPIKKHRMDLLIEKAVELGVAELHPILTARTENRILKMERLRAQMTEAAEQSERFDIPVIHEPVTLAVFLKQKNNFPVYACLERTGGIPIGEVEFSGEFGFLIGPEGGFDSQEMDAIEAAGFKILSLGNNVLRAETAAIICLSRIME